MNQNIYSEITPEIIKLSKMSQVVGVIDSSYL